MSLAVCPLCHRANRERAKHCDECDYEFGQSIDVLRGMLGSQLANARAMFWVLLVTDVVVLGAIVAIAFTHGYLLVPMLPFAFLVYQTFRAGKKVAITKHSLRLTEQKQLPRATIVSR